MAIALLLAGAALALGYLVQIALDRPGTGHWARSLLKTASTAALVGAGLASLAPGLVLLGLALGAAGDFFLSRPGKAMFLAGMAAFALGHIAYATAFWMRAGALGHSAHGAPFLAALAVFGLGVIGLGLWLSAKADALRWPVRAYALVIGAMGITALLLPQNPGDRTIQCGVALFLLSDTLLALRLFASPPQAIKPLELAVWPSYWLGQALILVGAVIYWEFPKG